MFLLRSKLVSYGRNPLLIDIVNKGDFGKAKTLSSGNGAEIIPPVSGGPPDTPAKLWGTHTTLYLTIASCSVVTSTDLTKTT
jgi:hypothetical protein